MVGNDVVDLHDVDADARTLSPRFDARVFDATERSALVAAPDDARLRWRLWAAKEAAYKMARRVDVRVVFSPRRFVVREAASLAAGSDAAIVHHPDSLAFVRYFDDDDCIHAVAVATADDLDEVVVGRARLRDMPHAHDPSAAVRALACQELGSRLGAGLRVVRHGRIPDLELEGGSGPKGLLSLSHHGDHVAYAWLPAARCADHGRTRAKAS